MFSRIYLIVFGIIAFRMDLTISDMEILQSIENLSSFGSGTSTVISAAARAGAGTGVVVSVPSSSSSSSSLSTTSSTTTTPFISSSLNEQNSESFLYDIESINNRYSTAINMSKSVTNVTVQIGTHAYLPYLTISDMEILQSIENLSSFGSGTSTVISAAARAGAGTGVVVSVPSSSSSSSSLSTTSSTTTTPFISSSLNEQNSESFLYDIESINNRYSTAINMSKSVTNVTVQIGTHAYLPCNIRRLLGKPVSWVRVRDGHILTVDQTTFIADQRFQSVFGDDNNNRWSLQIKYVQEHDMGLYECQVSTEPKMSSRVYLKVVVPKTELIGDQNRFVKAGSRVALHCIVRGSIEPPPYIIWYKGTKKITQDNKNGWFMQIDREIFGNNSDRQDTIGSLIIPHVTKSDSGNYTCTPSNSSPVTVDLHVLSGEYSASAIMSSATTISNNWIILLLLSTILFVLNKT